MFANRTNWNRRRNRLTELAAARAQAGTLLDLTVSNPTRCGFEYPQAEILAALARPEALLYRPEPLGLPSARAAVADYYAARGLAIDPSALLLTASTSEAYAHVFRLLCNPGDRVHVPRPSYPLFDLLAGIQDVELSSYALLYDHGWQLDLAALQAQITPTSRALLLVHPNNPTGTYLKQSEWSALLDLAARHQLAIVIDEVFFDYSLAGDAARLRDWRNDRALTFVLNGLSKISALPQMKLGWLLALGPTALAEEALGRLEVINDSFLSAASPIQCAAPALLAARHQLQPQIQQRLLTNLAALDSRLQRCPEVTRLAVEGGWTAVLRLPRLLPDEEWATWLLEQTGVLTHPGHFYDFPAEGYLVLSLLVEPTPFAEGIDRLLTAVTRHCAPTQ